LARRKQKETKDVETEPAFLTPEQEDLYLQSLAKKQAAYMLKNNTAPAPIVKFFLDQASLDKQLKLEKLRRENALMEAKTKAIESAEETEKMYAEAISAFKSYHGDRE